MIGLKELFTELRDKTMLENKYLRDHDEPDSEQIEKLSMIKRAIRDKIEKFQEKRKDAVVDDHVKRLIRATLILEKDNIEQYKKKMQQNREKMSASIREKEIGKSYVGAGVIPPIPRLDTKS